MTRLLAPLLLAAVLGSGTAAGQVTIGAQFAVGMPLGEFHERLDGALGFGVSGQALFAVPRTPVAVGAEIGFLVYGQETIREQFGSGAAGRVEIDVITTNNIALAHLLVRLQPLNGTFRPYLDGLIGMSYLFTQSRIEDVRGDRPEIAASTNFDDLTFSFGTGAGFQAGLIEAVGESGRLGQLSLDVRLRYLLGREAEYLKRGSIQETDDGDLIFDVERSRTDLLIPQIGLVLRF